MTNTQNETAAARTVLRHGDVASLSPTQQATIASYNVKTIEHSATLYLTALYAYGWDDEEHTIAASDQLDQDIIAAIAGTRGDVARLVRDLAFDLALDAHAQIGGAE